jgi:hypothetical protein
LNFKHFHPNGGITLCEEEGHVIMDCPFVVFQMNVDVVRHVELKNVAGTLMDQSQD